MYTILANVAEKNAVIPNIWPEFLTAGFGAFFGAVAAYSFERWRDHHKRMDSQHSAILQAQMMMICNVNSLESMKRDVLDVYRDHPNRNTHMPMFFRIMNTHDVDIGSLSFFLDGSAPEIPLDVHLTIQSYRNVVDAIEVRNNEFRQMIASAKEEGFDPTTKLTQGAVSASQLSRLKDMTDHVFTAVDKALERNKTCIIALADAGKKRFGKRRKMLRIEMKPNTPLG